MWTRWGHEVERHPWRYFVGAALVLVVLAIPLFSMQLGFPDDGTAPTSETRRRAYDLLSEGFGPGFNGPLLLAVEIDDPAALQELEGLTSAIEATEGVAAVTPPQPNEAGDAAIIQVIPTTSPQDQGDDRAGAATPGRHDPRSHAGGCGGPRRRGDGDVHRPVRSDLERLAVVHRRGRPAVVPAADGGVPLDPGAAQGGGAQPAVDRRRLRGRRRDLPVGMGPQPDRHRSADPDRQLRADDDVRGPVRALDGLRGLPALAHPRGVPEDREERRERGRAASPPPPA